jgi:hypothetical protein
VVDVVGHTRAGHIDYPSGITRNFETERNIRATGARLGVDMRFLAMTVVVLIALPYIVMRQNHWLPGERRYHGYPADLPTAIEVLKTEGDRAQKLHRLLDMAHVRLEAQDRIVEHLIGGEMTLAEAASQFSGMRTKEELQSLLEVCSCQTGQTDEERLCRHLLGLVKRRLTDFSGDDCCVMARLEEQMAAYVRSGMKLTP